MIARDRLAFEAAVARERAWARRTVTDPASRPGPRATAWRFLRIWGAKPGPRPGRRPGEGAGPTSPEAPPGGGAAA